jgi:hypothetical protein
MGCETSKHCSLGPAELSRARREAGREGVGLRQKQGTEGGRTAKPGILARDPSQDGVLRKMSKLLISQNTV